jgi:hypothetical protein
MSKAFGNTRENDSARTMLTICAFTRYRIPSRVARPAVAVPDRRSQRPRGLRLVLRLVQLTSRPNRGERPGQREASKQARRRPHDTESFSHASIPSSWKDHAWPELVPGVLTLLSYTTT